MLFRSWEEKVEPVKAMLITASQRVRPVLLTATVTALGVIPMALNVEFDFIRREIVTGGLAGSWFTHLSAALVSGLFVSTALTLVMVPVMITAPSVIGASLSRLWARFTGLFGRKQTAVTPDGTRIEIPSDADSAAKYIGKDGPTRPDEDGSSRQAAE